MNINDWINNRIKPEQYTEYLANGKDFINDELIEDKIRSNNAKDRRRFDEILAISKSIQTLSLDDTAFLLNVEDRDMLSEMRSTALAIKKKVYDNRIVTFAPIYLGSYCVNNCAYCGFKKDNSAVRRHILTEEEIVHEIEVLAGKIGHKRLIAVYGEHPKNDIDYMVNSIRAIYNVKVKTKNGYGQIRRVNVNAAPLAIENLKKLHEVGIGTYQVFQETYHHETYDKLHPKGTLKNDYKWRLYCMHRAFQAGIDDFGIGALFGLYDWKFEVMGLVAHALDLEKHVGIGPHTISFPRIEPAFNSPITQSSGHKVTDDDFLKLIVVLRLAVPYSGMIITARESEDIRSKSWLLGITQTDASTRIGVGGYSEKVTEQQDKGQQFLLGDTRSLTELIREFSSKGMITSFCTAGYRCGRTGECIMD
ncbi:MAG: [FeFe] hydrogenase H-cluster radical SAM maturase HydG, partial [Candidatus Omnitrophota bacterium]